MEEFRALAGDRIRCEDCGKYFVKTNKSNRCPKCREIPRRYVYQREENKEIAAEKRMQKLEDDVAKAKKKGMSYGQLQAERYKKKKVTSNIAALRERQREAKATAFEKARTKMSKETQTPKEEVIAPVQSEPDPEMIEVPISVKAWVSVHISELEKELAELKEFKARYSKCV